MAFEIFHQGRKSKCVSGGAYSDRAVLLGLFVLMAAISESKGANGVWANNTSDASADWSLGTNWTSGNIPGVTNLSTSNTDSATFSAAVTVETPNLDVSRRLGVINIDNTQADYSITSSSSSNVFYLGNTTGLSITGGGSTTIAPILNVGNNTQTWSTGSTALTLTNGITYGAARTLTLTNTTAIVMQGTLSAGVSSTLIFSGTGSMNITGVVQNGGGGSAITTINSSATYSGTISLNGANTFDSLLIWRAGTLELGSSSALGAATNALQIGTTTAGSSDAYVLTTGAYTVSRNITVSATTTSSAHTIGGSQTSGTSVYSGTVTMNAHPGGFRLTAATGGTVDFSNTISGSNSADSITKVGGGVVRLTQSTGNTYVGGTTVSAGTLLINNSTGSGTGTGIVAVSSGGTMGGTGVIAPNGSNSITVASGGSVAPGEGIGTLTFNLAGSTGKLTMQSGADFKFQLGTANAGIGSIAAGSSDLLAVTGASSGDVVFNSTSIDFLGTGSAGYYKLFDTSSDNANTWTNLVFDGTTGLVSSGLLVSNLGSGLTGSLIVGTASNGAGNVGDIYLQVVPEPSVYALFGSGLGALIVRRRRKLQK